MQILLFCCSSSYSEVWYRACLGDKRSSVQIRLARPLFLCSRDCTLYIKIISPKGYATFQPWTNVVVSAHSSKAGSLVGTMVGIAHVVERRAVTAINRVQISILTPGIEVEVVEILACHARVSGCESRRFRHR